MTSKKFMKALKCNFLQLFFCLLNVSDKLSDERNVHSHKTDGEIQKSIEVFFWTELEKNFFLFFHLKKINSHLKLLLFVTLSKLKILKLKRYEIIKKSVKVMAWIVKSLALLEWFALVAINFLENFRFLEFRFDEFRCVPSKCLTVRSL